MTIIKIWYESQAQKSQYVHRCRNCKTSCLWRQINAPEKICMIYSSINNETNAHASTFDKHTSTHARTHARKYTERQRWRETHAVRVRVSHLHCTFDHCDCISPALQIRPQHLPCRVPKKLESSFLPCINQIRCDFSSDVARKLYVAFQERRESEHDEKTGEYRERKKRRMQEERRTLGKRRREGWHRKKGRQEETESPKMRRSQAWSTIMKFTKRRRHLTWSLLSRSLTAVDDNWWCETAKCADAKQEDPTKVH